MPTALGVRQLTAGAKMLRDFQNAPDIPRPNLLAQQIPVVGSAWQAVADVQDGNYGSALLNGASAVAELTPVGAAATKGARVLRLGSQLLEVAPKARTVTRQMRSLKVGLSGPGEEIHHVIRLRGTPRNVPDPRNHPLLLKVLPKETHRRLHGSFNGKDKFGPIGQVWHGTTAAMKTVPVGLLGYTVGSVENTQRASPGRAAARPAPSRTTPPARPAPTGRSR